MASDQDNDDARILDRAAEILQQHVTPAKFTGQVLLATVVKFLRGTADDIRREGRPTWRAR